MASSKFKHVKISGISTVVPSKEICIYDEAQYYGGNVKKIDRMRKMIGFYKRRVVDNETTTPSDLAICAAEKLLNGMNIDRSTIDGLLLVVQTPDFLAPASAFLIHSKLGLSHSCMALDINLGCPGWVYGMQLAHCMIESGAYKRILLLVADTPSTKVDIADRVNAPLFGDAASATLIEYSEATTDDTFFNLGADGDGYDAIIIPAGGARLPLRFGDGYREDYNEILTSSIISKSGHSTNLTQKQMDGMKVFDFTMKVVPQKIKDIMKEAAITPSDVDKLVLHQANKQIIESVCNLSGFPLDMCSSSTFEQYGNQTVVSVPSVICHTLQKEISSDNGIRILCAGFGIGLAWGTCVITLRNVFCNGIEIFDTNTSQPSREEFAQYWIKKIKG